MRDAHRSAARGALAGAIVVLSACDSTPRNPDVPGVARPSLETILLSEIESRQYVTFAGQPTGLQFRLDYTGRFAPNARVTTEYEPHAKIFSISIPNPGAE